MVDARPEVVGEILDEYSPDRFMHHEMGYLDAEEVAERAPQGKGKARVELAHGALAQEPSNRISSKRQRTE